MPQLRGYFNKEVPYILFLFAINAYPYPDGGAYANIGIDIRHLPLPVKIAVLIAIIHKRTGRNYRQIDNSIEYKIFLRDFAIQIGKHQMIRACNKLFRKFSRIITVKIERLVYILSGIGIIIAVCLVRSSKTHRRVNVHILAVGISQNYRTQNIR